MCKDRRPEGRGGGKCHALRVGGQEHQNLREFERHACCALVFPPTKKAQEKKSRTLQWHTEYTTERDAPHLHYYCITRLLQTTVRRCCMRGSWRTKCFGAAGGRSVSEALSKTRVPHAYITRLLHTTLDYCTWRTKSSKRSARPAMLR